MKANAFFNTKRMLSHVNKIVLDRSVVYLDGEICFVFDYVKTIYI